MFVRIICFVIAVNAVFSKSVHEELSEIYNSGGKPYPELPCTLIGGSCARQGGCPADSQEVSKGLCPMQQNNGIECCKPALKSKSTQLTERPALRCRSRGGSCESTADITCPGFLTIKEATDCGKNEVCCVLVK